MLIAALVGALALAYSRDRKLFLAGIWFLVALIPVLRCACLVSMADRYLYIPSLGLCFAARILLARLTDSPALIGYRPLVIALPLAMLFVLTWQRNAG